MYDHHWVLSGKRSWDHSFEYSGIRVGFTFCFFLYPWRNPVCTGAGVWPIASLKSMVSFKPVCVELIISYSWDKIINVDYHRKMVIWKDKCRAILFYGHSSHCDEFFCQMTLPMRSTLRVSVQAAEQPDHRFPVQRNPVAVEPLLGPNLTRQTDPSLNQTFQPTLKVGLHGVSRWQFVTFEKSKCYDGVCSNNGCWWRAEGLIHSHTAVCSSSGVTSVTHSPFQLSVCWFQLNMFLRANGQKICKMNCLVVFNGTLLDIGFLIYRIPISSSHACYPVELLANCLESVWSRKHFCSG